MKIRSITYFCNPRYPLEEKVIQKAGEFLATARSAYEAAGYEVQTARLATVPFPNLLGEEHIEKLPALTRQLADIASPLGIGYFSLGPALPEMPRSYQVIPDAIFVAKDAFFSGVMADKTRGIDLAAVRACAEVIVKCAPIEPNGFANLQFAALANVPAGAPFFPAAYHNNDKPAFAIATESADLAVQAFENAKSMEEGRNTLTAEIEKHGRKLTGIARSLRVRFYGIDFSLAPFPDDAHSLGNAVEKMGVSKIGLHGSLAAAALLTEAVDRANFPHTGFSGFMQPVLEDSVLAKRAAEGTLTIKDALLYSAVCGTGLDTVPLPGDATAEQLIPLLLDLSALALRLDKPLTARLMPVPGKKAGDETNFDFGFFANSKVMALDSTPLHPPFTSNEVLSIKKR
ncbi:MAG: PFL family protein [Anaerolineales bacterium]